MTVKIIDNSFEENPFFLLDEGVYSTVVIVCKWEILHTFCPVEDEYKYITTPITEDVTIYLYDNSIHYTTSNKEVIIPLASIIQITVKN